MNVSCKISQSKNDDRKNDKAWGKFKKLPFIKEMINYQTTSVFQVETRFTLIFLNLLDNKNQSYIYIYIHTLTSHRKYNRDHENMTHIIKENTISQVKCNQHIESYAYISYT